jgi:hypothetical protein
MGGNGCGWKRVKRATRHIGIGRQLFDAERESRSRLAVHGRGGESDVTYDDVRAD